MLTWLRRSRVKNKYVLSHEHENMDRMLETAFHDERSEAGKMSVVSHVCQDGLLHIHTERTVLGVLEVSTKWVLYGTASLQVSSGYRLFSTWGTRNIHVFVSYFTPGLVNQLLADTPKRPQNGPLLLREGFRVLCSQRRSEVYRECARTVQNSATKYVSSTHNSHLVRNLALLLEEFNECLPSDEGEAVRFCYAVLNHLRFTEPVLGDENFTCYTDDIARLLSVVWKHHHQTVLAKSLHFLFCVISAPCSDRLPAPSFCLAAVVRYIPMEVAHLVVRDIVTDSSISDESIGIAVSQIVDWLRWPTAENMDLWILSFLTQLASARKFDLLAGLTVFNARQLADNLLEDDSPSLWRASFSVLSHMLLSFQHSPEPFHQCLETMTVALERLRRTSGLEPGAPLNQLAMLIYCLMHQHSGFSDLYLPVLNLIQDISPPTPELMNSVLDSTKWTSSLSSSLSPSPSGCLLMQDIVLASASSSEPAYRQKKLERGKTGLVNLGNTCYMNSVIQSLYMCDQFRKAVLGKMLPDRRNLMGMLQYIFAYLSQTNRPAITPNKFLQVSRPSWFLPDHQQDCSEFLKYLLNQLHDQEMSSNVDKDCPEMDTLNSNSTFKLNARNISKAERKKSMVLLTSVKLKMKEMKSSYARRFSCDSGTGSAQSLVETYFAGKVQTTVRCMACKQESATVESFVDISLAFPDTSKSTTHLRKSLAGGSSATFETLDIENLAEVEPEASVQREDGVTLNDLISHYLTSEKLIEENKYHCGYCETLQDGDRSLQIIESPQYLILTLLRFSYDSKLQTRTKIFKDVHYPCTLSIPVYEQASNTQFSGHCPKYSKLSSAKSSTGSLNSHRVLFEDIAKRLAPKCENSTQEPHSFQLYGLTAVIVHSGSSSECGHYYCYARHCQDGRVDPEVLDQSLNDLNDLDLLPDTWYCFNDRKVDLCTLRSFRNGIKKFSKDTAYVLIYRKLHLGCKNKGSNPDPTISPELMEEIARDNELYVKEQELQAKLAGKPRALRSSSLSSDDWHPYQGKSYYDVEGTNGPSFVGNDNEIDFTEPRFVF